MLSLIMTDLRTYHIAEDEELLGRFVLGTLGEDERLAVEQHIAGCDACAAAVRRERLIAAGVRRLGRDQLKNVLRESPGLETLKPVLWPKIVSAAAVIGLIVGAGLYYDWLGSGNVPATTEQFKQDIAREERAKTEAPPVASVPRVRDESKDLADARREPQSFARSAPGAAEKKPARADEPAPRKVQGELSAAQPSGAGVKRETEGIGGEAAAPSAAFWTEGTQLGGTHEDVGAAQAADKVSAESQVLSKELDRKSKSANQLKAAVNEKSSSVSNYLVNQAPASDLPRERQMIQQRNAGGGVQTLVKQDGDVTTMTIYLDSLVDPVEVKNASVEPASDDSVVVTLGKQRIGYRLPQTANTAKKK